MAYKLPHLKIVQISQNAGRSNDTYAGVAQDCLASWLYEMLWELYYLKMNYMFEKIALFDCMNFR